MRPSENVTSREAPRFGSVLAFHPNTVTTFWTIGNNYMGPVWYRQSIRVPPLPPGKNVYLWLGATDGSTKVFVVYRADQLYPEYLLRGK